MKTKKALKILSLAFIIAVLAIGFCFAASAAEETSELSVSIIKKNVSYSDYVKVLFAVDDTYAGGGEVELLYYFEDPTVNQNAEEKVGAVYHKGYTDDSGNNYPAFYSASFPAKEIHCQVYARAHIVGTDIYSDVVRYSVVEYLLERLYVDDVTGDQKDLYNDLLSYGASAQKVLINGNSNPADDITKFITDYVLVGIENGTLDGKYDQGIYFVDDTVYPQADGIATWDATVYDLSTGVETTAEANNGAAYNVTGFTMFTEKAKVAYKPNLTDTAGRILWSELGTPAEYKSADIIDEWTQTSAGSVLEIVDGDPYGESSKVIHQKTAASGNQDQLYIKTTANSANATMYVFETDVMIDPDVKSLYEITFRAANIAYTAYVTADMEGNISIYGKVNSDNNTAPISSVTAEGAAGNWFRFRMEYIDVTETTAKVKFYYNENQIGESEEFTKTYSASQLTRVIIAADKNAVGDMYIDNTKAAYEAEAYVPTLTPDAKVETYEDGDALDTFRFDNNPSSGAGAVTDGTPYGTASKVYGFTYVAGYETNFRVTNGTGVYNGTDTFVFESDVMINSTAATEIQLQLRLASPSKEGLRILLTTDAIGAVYLKTSGNAVISPVAPGGAWFRLRIEAKGSGVNIFINDVQVGSTQSISIDGETVNRFRLYMNSGSGAIYFDNTKVLFVSN
ncbi:MAG: hypothetical protein IKJ13_03650 [Clostridia bacterium]|nr:hypothetical protein [Clostridia bacterium]